MAEYLSPGVYVEEFESGSVPMEGVGTSTAGFIGVTERGNIEGLPELVTSFADFKRKFGGYLSESEFGDYRFLPYAVEHFFVNGGSRAFIARVMPSNAKCSKAFVPSKEEPVIKLEAKNPGVWGNDLKAIITPASKAKTQILSEEETSTGKKYKVKNGDGFNVGDIIVFTDGSEKIYNIVSKSQDNYIEFEKEFNVDVVDKNIIPNKTISTCEFNIELRYSDIVEVYENASFNVQASNYIDKKAAKSELAVINCLGKYPEEITSPFDMINSDASKSVLQIDFTNGSNGSADKLAPDDFIGKDNGPGKRTGIQAFIDNDVVSIMAVPGVTDPNVQLMLVAHCENLGSRFAVLDVPKDLKKVTDVSTHREMFDSNYAAMYHPWLQVFDPLDKKNIFIPPSGSVLGIYARSDNTRGVHKAPANEVVRGCTGLDCQYNKGEQDILNPKGVNLIRSFPGQGIRVWGARTCTSNAQWKYINVRRLFIYIEESIKANTNWVVFEPNDELLWIRVSRTVEAFLTTLWRNGALAGTTTDEAFFVNVGRNTMSQDDIDNGRLICAIGVAPVKPAEFVIFRITQKTNENA
ncbi:phage tail sheath protein FI [Clostridium carnis]|uniref:Phage tail sheath protein FI n=1 Tax=Clostridium carnis TaxID=1530 RepID=A0ABY6SQ71_9CLOT|nr:phage tail sheath family protein [Clostridium carnis]VDG69794.1 phage tail sheath protein FI [Clostridium carnis]